MKYGGKFMRGMQGIDMRFYCINKFLEFQLDLSLPTTAPGLLNDSKVLNTPDYLSEVSDYSLCNDYLA